MIKWLLLGAQGALIGYVAGLAFPDWGWQFWVILLVNAQLMFYYGQETGKEK
jgi:hypothetical protein